MALDAHLEFIADNGDSLPEPTSAKQYWHDEDCQGGFWVVFREEMCYPIKSEKEKVIENIVDIICAVQYVPPKSSLEQEIANKLYDAGLRFKDDNVE